MANQRILRVFIKPAGQVCVDIPLCVDHPMGTVFDAWKRDGALIGQETIVPWDSVLYAVTLQLPAETRPVQVFPFPGKDPA